MCDCVQQFVFVQPRVHELCVSLCNLLMQTSMCTSRVSEFLGYKSKRTQSLTSKHVVFVYNDYIYISQ